MPACRRIVLPPVVASQIALARIGTVAERPGDHLSLAAFRAGLPMAFHRLDRCPFDRHRGIGACGDPPPDHLDHLVHKAIARDLRSEEHTSELQSLMRISYAVFCLKKKK